MAMSRQQLLDSIHSGMTLTKSFFKSVYAKEITWPGFSEEAIEALEAAGCSKARGYYNNVVSEYEKKHDEEMKEVAAWYRKECEREWQKRLKVGEEKRTQKKQTRNEKWTELSQILNFR